MKHHRHVERPRLSPDNRVDPRADGQVAPLDPNRERVADRARAKQVATLTHDARIRAYEILAIDLAVEIMKRRLLGA